MFSQHEELIQHVYGYSLQSLHGDAEDMTQQLSIAKSRFQRSYLAPRQSSENEPLSDKEKQMLADHMSTRLSTGKYYQVCKRVQGEEAAAGDSFVAFQVICKHPERRSYVQRVCFLGKDVSWQLINADWNFLVIFFRLVSLQFMCVIVHSLVTR